MLDGLATAVRRVEQAVKGVQADGEAVTTLTALLRAGSDRFALLHIGDTRALMLRRGTLAQLTRDLQGLALAPKGIRVNAIAPGSIEFPGGAWASRKASDDPLYQRTLDRIPWGRLGTPDEVAMVALFLASDMGSWVTGQTIVVDGGQSLA